MSRRGWRRILGTMEARTEAALKATPRPDGAGLEALTLEELRELKAIRAKLAAGLALDPQELERGRALILKMETAAAAKYPGRSSFTPEDVAAMWLEYAGPSGPLPPLPPPTRETPQPTEHP